MQKLMISVNTTSWGEMSSVAYNMKVISASLTGWLQDWWEDNALKELK